MLDGDIARSLTPDALRAAYAELATGRDDLRVQGWILQGQGSLELQWLNSIGVAREPELAELCPPLPPVELRQITAATDAETFLWTGFVDACTFAELFEEHIEGAGPTPQRALDFGCGCGRLSRVFGAVPDRWQAFGCDINPDHVQWCRENLTGVDTRSNGAVPPLPFDDASMDLVYSLSVFSHLPDYQARAWLDDIARVLRPGGVLVITTHGDTALQVMADSPGHQQMFGLDAAAVGQIRAEVGAQGFAYRRLSSDVVAMANVDADYGHAFAGETYVAAEWTRGGLELCRYLPGGLRGWQDVAVLRRPLG